MKQLIYFCGILFLFFSSCQSKNTSLLTKGVSLNLATYRKTQVKNVVYRLSFKIPNKKSDPIKSVLVLDLNLQDLQHPLYLDFKDASSSLKSIMVNNVNVKVKHYNEHIVIDQRYLKLNNNTITISFIAGELSLNRNKEYIYTLLVPDRARTLFPCFDQPNIKSHYILEITAPKSWQVLCSSKLDFKEDKGDFVKHTFTKSDKMSTYLFSFVAGKFSDTTQSHTDLDMKLLYRENNKNKITASLNPIFKLHENAISFLENYTQKKFPFQKLDFASIPGFQYGGMEHVGAIQYRESSLFLDDNATQNQKLRRGKLIAHETAHMWFGDLVTMKWFNDVWLKEVFANFMADKIINPAFSEINHDLSFITSHYPSAYSEDRTKGTNAIKQKLDNLENAGTLYGRIIYNKAPIMMRQLEAAIGAENFKKGIRNYIKKYANTNADWNDLVSILNAETKIDLKTWSDVWVNQSGRPIIRDTIVYQDNYIKSFKIYQKAEDGTDKLWPQKFEIALIYSDSIYKTKIDISTRELELKTLKGLAKPQNIIYNYDGFGYGVFPINPNTIQTIPFIKNNVARGYAYINLFENMLIGKIPAKKTIEILINGLLQEKEELILKLVSNEISRIFWQFLNTLEQEEILKKLNFKLQVKLNKNTPSNFKKIFFNLYTNTVYSEEGKDFMYQIWRKNIKLNQLNLNEDDFTNLAFKLALYNHKKANDILKKAKKDITNPDRQERFMFLTPSLSNNETERDLFMLSLKKLKNRAKENWVLTALSNIHHPLRQKSSKKHLKMCLNLLEEIQLTGDIFFPKGWLNSTIGNYSSKEAYSIVKLFLDENPNFSPILKHKLLQSADGLFRAQHIKNKK